MGRILLILGLVLICLFVMVLIVSYHDIHRFVTVHYRIKMANIKAPVRICLISDLHGCVHGEANRDLIEAIDREKPDLLVLAGDVINGGEPRETLEIEMPLLQHLASHYPVYAGNGNHESKLDWYPYRYNGFDRKFKEIYKDMGIRLLIDDSEYIEDYGIRISSIELGKEFYRRFYERKMGEGYMEGKLGKADLNVCNLLIAHNPRYFKEYAAWGADLTLSGHVHGGIMRLPLLGGVISPAFILFPKYDGGEFDMNGKKMVLSRGLGVHTLPFRVFNPCELVIIDLDSDQ